MSLALLALAALCAVNPARTQAALPRQEPARVAALGATLAWAALIPVVALADAALDAAQVASSTLRMAAGVVLVLQGAVAVLTRGPGPEPALPGRRAALVPVAFPVLLTPALALLALSGALDRSAPVALAVLGAALAAVPLLGAIAMSPVRQKVVDGLGRLAAAGLVVSGMALLMNGIFDL
jgi:small neutral amino acid transporter SnatA (MarC family)